MSADARLRALLVDPSLFTAPYDAALSEGLIAAGVAPCWAIRPTREGDRSEIAPEHVALLFYTRVDGIQRGPARLRAVAKGLAHVAGLVRLVRWVHAQRPDVVHFQWAVVPWLDTLAIRLLRRWCPVLLTVHDTTPFNGERATRWQSLAVGAPLAAADRLIVHTRSARAELLRRGFASDDVALIPHGPLRLGATPSPRALQRSDARHTFVLFGELKHYKGLDVLVEALGRLPEGLRRAARVIIAGRPRMELDSLLARIAELGLSGCVELRARRLSEQEMADLFAGADAFVFPYRQVDASGVYFLVKACSRWIIASELGIFAEDVVDGVQGRLVPAENAAALSAAMAEAIQQRPQPAALGSSAAWPAIGGATAQLYREALAARRLQPLPARWLARGAFSSITALLVLGALAFVIIYWLERRAEPLSALDAVVSVAEAADARGAGAAAPSPAAVGAPTPVGFSAESGYRLAKNWDFRSSIRDERALRAEFFTRYIYAGGTLDHLNDEWSRYRDADNHVFSAEGLALTARVRSGLAASELAPGAIESGMLRSRWSGQYGVFEIRMKAPAGRGLWPAFWLNPQDGVWPPEIDVIEMVDNGRDSTRQGYHFVHGVDERKTPLFSRLNASHAYAPGADYSEAFHVFSVEWTPERVRHRVDGVLVVEREFRWLHADGKDAGPAHVLVNLAVGGRWPGPPAAAALPARLVIDYIRAWQR